MHKGRQELIESKDEGEEKEIWKVSQVISILLLWYV